MSVDMWDYEDTCLITVETRIPLAVRTVMDRIIALPLKTRERLCGMSPPINTRHLAEAFLQQEKIDDLEAWIEYILLTQ